MRAMDERTPPEEVAERISAFIEERKQWPRFVKVLQELQDIRNGGESHLGAWSEIYSAFNGEDNDLVALAGQFFVVTAAAHLECATLRAAKLLEEGREAVSLKYLLNLATNEARADFPDRWQTLKAVVPPSESELRAIAAEPTRIKRYRDRHLAHTDRRTIGSWFEAVDVIEAERLRGVFETSNSILQRFWQILPEYHTPEAPSECEDWLGPRGLCDLFYFARYSARDASIPDPSAYVKNVRSIERALQKAKVDVHGARREPPKS